MTPGPKPAARSSNPLLEGVSQPAFVCPSIMKTVSFGHFILESRDFDLEPAFRSEAVRFICLRASSLQIVLLRASGP